MRELNFGTLLARAVTDVFAIVKIIGFRQYLVFILLETKLRLKKEEHGLLKNP